MAKQSPFTERVLAAVASLKSGEIVTYGEIAAEIGHPRSARAVGTVLRRNGRNVPWWRVVAANGRLVPGNERVHSEHLQAEGVKVAANHVIMGHYVPQIGELANAQPD